MVIITGLLALVAVPALTMGNESRRTAAMDELIRTLELTRARAIATGRPHGLSVDSETENVGQLWLPTAASTPARAIGADGSETREFPLSSRYGGCEIVAFEGGDGSTLRGVIWFGHDGVPQARSAAGSLIGPWTRDATLTLTGGRVITVDRLTGAVQP